MKDTKRKPAKEQGNQQLQVFREEANDENDVEMILDFERHARQKETEAYWAGRNHAQRRSARVAA
jgi:hypothetical protein